MAPRRAQSLGRQVANFSQLMWEQHRERVVFLGNYYKFRSDEGLRALLLGTGERELVEASPRDRVWGVGFSAAVLGQGEVRREEWGLNLLGQALMRVRRVLREEEMEREGDLERKRTMDERRRQMREGLKERTREMVSEDKLGTTGAEGCSKEVGGEDTHDRKVEGEPGADAERDIQERADQPG
jgi:hypothetical protein